MIGRIRISKPYSNPSGRGTDRHRPRGRLRTFMGIAFRILLFFVAAAAVLSAGLTFLDPVAMWQWMDDSWVLLLLFRICVYLAVVWWGPLLRGARGEDLDRARLALAGFAVFLELTGSIWMIP